MTPPMTPREKVRKAIIDVMKPKDADITLGRVDTCTDAILTALASGSGDHAELARLANEVENNATPLAVSLYRNATAPHHILALLAENAALRAERDEAVGLVKEYVFQIETPELLDAARTFLSKEAERG